MTSRANCATAMRSPVFIGAAEHGNGVTRLLKALRHEAPGIVQTRERLGVPHEGPPVAQVIRTIHTAHGGKLSVARVLRGSFATARPSSRRAARRTASPDCRA